MSDVASRPELMTVEPVPRVILTEEQKQKPIWELVDEVLGEVPAEEQDRIPHDGAVIHDHYLYGARKRGVE
jgi:hypothetical protein